MSLDNERVFMMCRLICVFFGDVVLARRAWTDCCANDFLDSFASNDDLRGLPRPLFCCSPLGPGCWMSSAGAGSLRGLPLPRFGVVGTFSSLLSLRSCIGGYMGGGV